MSATEHRIERAIQEGTEVLHGELGEPPNEEAWADLAGMVIGDLADDYQGAVEDAEREQARYYAMRDDRDRLQALVDAHKGFLRDALNRLGGQ